MNNIFKKGYEWIKNNKIYISIYIFFFIFCALTPISGDDYMNYVRGQEGIIGILNWTKTFYLTWEGRIVSRVIILLFTAHKFLWNIITPLLYVLIFKSLLQINVFKNKYSYILLFLSIILVKVAMVAQSYTWLAGNITYFYPTALSIYYFSTLYKNMDNKTSVKRNIVLSILAIIIPMFTENIGCAFVFGNILFVIYLKYFKKNIKKNCIFTILSIIALVLMLISPGSANRAVEEGGFYSLDLLEKIEVTMNYTLIPFSLTRNTTMLILMLICGNIYITQKIKHKGILGIICVIYNIIPIFTILQNILNVNMGILNIFTKIQLFYWIIFCIIFILAIIENYKNDKKILLFNILLFMTAMSSIICMLVAWPWGDRISILFVIIVSYISIGIIDKNVKINNVAAKLLEIFCILSVVWIIFSIFCAYKIDRYRIKYINEQKNADPKKIEVIYNPSRYLWLSNIDNEYFVDTYKKYQGIDDEIQLILKKLSLEEYVRIIFSK